MQNAKENIDPSVVDSAEVIELIDYQPNDIPTNNKKPYIKPVNGKAIKRKSIYEKVLFLSLTLLPINGFYLGSFNELLFEVSFYPYLFIFPLIGILFLKKTYKSSFLSNILLLFMAWTLVSGVVNIYDLTHGFTRGVSAYSRFAKQFLLIIIGFSLVVFISNVVLHFKISLDKMSKYIVYSIKACVFVGIIEVLGKFMHIGICLEIFNFISSLVNRNPFIPGRVHSLSGEASWYGMYSSFAYPFLLTNVFEKNKNKFLMLLFLITIYFTMSRTTYVVILIETLVFLMLFIRSKKFLNYKRLGIWFVTLGIAVGIIGYFPSSVQSISETVSEKLSSITDLSGDSNESFSSMARLGMQATAVNIGIHNPVFGIGEGQFAFHFAEYVPVWALAAPEIAAFISEPNAGWPQVHGIYPRIFAELGAIGLCIWLSLWVFSLVNIIKARKNADEETKKDSRLLICVIIGVFTSGFNVDSFRMMIMWIALGIIAGWYLKLKNTKHT